MMRVCNTAQYQRACTGTTTHGTENSGRMEQRILIQNHTLIRMSRETCPHCGASIDYGVRVCPNCRIAIIRKSRVIPYLIIGCVIFVAIVLALVLLFLPAPQHAPEPVPQPVPKPALQPAVIPAAAEVPVPTLSCTIAITGKKNPPATIQLQVITSTCFPGDITELRVSVNGKQEGTLSVQARFERDVYRHVRFQQRYRGCKICQWGRERGIPERGAVISLISNVASQRHENQEPSNTFWKKPAPCRK